MKSDPKSMFQNIPLSAIVPDPNQPRKHFDDAGLTELAQSIAVNGLAVPVLVRPSGSGYMLVHGERRWRAAQRIGWETISAEVRNLTDDEARRLALIENLQREALTPIEEARAFTALIATGLTQAEVGAQIGKGQSYIAQKLRLLTLPGPLLALSLSENHLRQLLTLRSWYSGVSEALGKPDCACTTPEMVGVLAAMRPLDYLVPMRVGGDRAAEITAAWNAFFDGLPAEGAAPVWHRVALWFGTLAILAPLTVADLTRVLSSFRSQVYSAVAGIRPGDRPGRGGTTSDFHYWGYRADLRHAGLRIGEIPGSITGEILSSLGRDLEGFLVPSSCQAGGQNYEHYLDAKAREGG